MTSSTNNFSGPEREYSEAWSPYAGDTDFPMVNDFFSLPRNISQQSLPASLPKLNPEKLLNSSMKMMDVRLGIYVLALAVCLGVCLPPIFLIANYTFIAGGVLLGLGVEHLACNLAKKSLLKELEQVWGMTYSDVMDKVKHLKGNLAEKEQKELASYQAFLFQYDNYQNVYLSIGQRIMERFIQLIEGAPKEPTVWRLE